MDAWTCPACGHTQDSTKRYGRNVICEHCDEMFPAPKALVTKKQFEERKAVVAKEEQAAGPWWLRLLLGDPSRAIEAGVTGAIGGVVAGIVAGIFNGLVAGNTTMRATIGCVLGLSVGLAIGAIWGRHGILARIGLSLPPVIAAALGGALVGAAISAIVGQGVLGSGAWLPVGMAAGAAASGLWALICIRVEAGEAPRPRAETDPDLSAYYESRLKRR